MRRALPLLAPLFTVGGCGSDDTPVRDCSFVAFYQASTAQPAQSVSLIGDFNAWDPHALPLTQAPGGYWFGKATPAPGWHRYAIASDGQAELDSVNPLTFGDDQQATSAVRVPDCGQPALAVRNFATDPSGSVDVDVQFLAARGKQPLDARSIVARAAGAQFSVENGHAGAFHLHAAGLAAGKYRLVVDASDAASVAAETLQLPFWIDAQPFDWQGALIYQVVVDRFRKGGGALDASAPPSYYHGGDLAGVVEALEDGYFDRLGVSALWLSPLYQNPNGAFARADGHLAEAYHGYWPSAPRTVEDRFGGEQALDALIAAAHRHGIRVVADGVLNHLHEQHPYYAAHRDDGWFNHTDGSCVCGVTCDWSTHMQDCWFDSFLPDLRWESTDVVSQLVDDATWWLDRFDLDGMRIDAVPMMPRLATRHLRHAVAQRLEQSGNPIYLVGETYTGPGGQPWIRSYLGPAGLSGQFDYPVLWVLRSALTGRASFVDLDGEVRNGEAAWAGSGAVMAPIVGSHDVARFISELNGDSLDDAWNAPPPAPTVDAPYALATLGFAFLLTQPGAPVLYYGDEFGMPGAGDPDNRRDMRFGSALSSRESALLQSVQRLGRARRCSLALRRGTRRTLWVDDDLYIFSRDAGDGIVAVVAINKGHVPRGLQVDIPTDESFVDGTPVADLFGAAAKVQGRTIAVTVAPQSAALLFTETACAATW